MTFTLFDPCLKKRKADDNLRLNYCSRKRKHNGRCVTAALVDNEWVIVHRHGK